MTGSISTDNLTRLDLYDISTEAHLNSSTNCIPINEDLFDWEIWGYALVVPLICLVGTAANTISLTVFCFADLKESLYTYLTALSVADLMTVVLVLFSGISRGVGKTSFFWSFVDVFLHIPIASVSTTISIIALVTVTVERLVIIKFPMESRSFFTSTKAKRNCWIITIFSIIFNIPYCFLFTIRDGKIIYSQFGSTRYYKIHNWIRLFVLGFLPGLILLVSNILLLLSLQKSRKRRISLFRPPLLSSSNSSLGQQSNKSSYLVIEMRKQSPTFMLPKNSIIDKAQHKRITIVLISMICSFLVGEFPTHIASRSSAVSLIFPNEPHLFNERNFRIFKLISTILMSCHYSCNFFLYYAFNKRFIRELKRLWLIKIRPIFHKRERLLTWNSSTSNERVNRIVTVTPNDGSKQKKTDIHKKRKISSVTRVSFKIGLSKKIYRESGSQEDIEMDKISGITSSI